MRLPLRTEAWHDEGSSVGENAHGLPLTATAPLCESGNINKWQLLNFSAPTSFPQPLAGLSVLSHYIEQSVSETLHLDQ